MRKRKKSDNSEKCKARMSQNSRYFLLYQILPFICFKIGVSFLSGYPIPRKNPYPDPWDFGFLWIFHSGFLRDFQIPIPIPGMSEFLESSIQPKIKNRDPRFPGPEMFENLVSEKTHICEIPNPSKVFFYYNYHSEFRKLSLLVF